MKLSLTFQAWILEAKSQRIPSNMDFILPAQKHQKPHFVGINVNASNVIFTILVDFSYFGTNAQKFYNTNFGFNSIILSFSIPFTCSKVL